MKRIEDEGTVVGQTHTHSEKRSPWAFLGVWSWEQLQRRPLHAKPCRQFNVPNMRQGLGSGRLIN